MNRIIAKFRRTGKLIHRHPTVDSRLDARSLPHTQVEAAVAAGRIAPAPLPPIS